MHDDAARSVHTLRVWGRSLTWRTCLSCQKLAGTRWGETERCSRLQSET